MKVVPIDAEFDKFLRPGIAVDVVLLAIINNELQVALIKREDEPYSGKHALPGRFVRYDERITDTARLAIELKGNISAKKVYLEQLYTLGDDLRRDTRIRTISIIYYGLVDEQVISQQKNNKFLWCGVTNLPALAFDHKNVITFTVDRIREKLFHTGSVFRLMPLEFTLSELQKAYELILGSALDKRNFRKKIDELYVLKDLKKTKMEGAHRPAALYSFVQLRK